MRNTAIHMLETVFGAVLFALGLFHLTEQEKNLNLLVNTVKDKLMEDENIYQEYNLVDLNQVPREVLFAIVMGYREHPITIDGIVIGADDNDYEYYFALIKDGIYQKKYDYDANHNIIQVNFLHIGL